MLRANGRAFAMCRAPHAGTKVSSNGKLRVPAVGLRLGVVVSLGRRLCSVCAMMITPRSDDDLWAAVAPLLLALMVVGIVLATEVVTKIMG